MHRLVAGDDEAQLDQASSASPWEEFCIFNQFPRIARRRGKRRTRIDGRERERQGEEKYPHRLKASFINSALLD